MNITIDDASPQMQFTPVTGWPYNATGICCWYHGTSHGTWNDGDAMTLSFNGSAVYVYGSMKSTHGYFSAQLDGGNIQYLSGYSATDLGNNQLIYSAEHLGSDKEHTVQLVNLPSQTLPPANGTIQWWLTVDYAVVTTAVTGQVYTTIIDDTSNIVNYQGTSWGDGPPLEPQNYHNQTAHITAGLNDYMTLDFNGSSIQLFGGRYKDHGNYTIDLDGIRQGSYNGSWYTLLPTQSLFQANNLNDGPHNIRMTTIGGGDTAPGSYIDFDYAVINSTINPAGTASNTPGTNSTSGTITSASTGASPATTSVTVGAKSSKTNIGAIAGGVVGGVVALALLALLAWFLLRRRRNKRQTFNEKPHVDLTGDEVQPYPQPGDNGASSAYTTLQTPSHGYSTSRGITSPSAREADLAGTPFLTHMPPPPASNATSYPHSVNPPSSAGMGQSPIEENSQYPNPFTSRNTYGSIPTSSPPSSGSEAFSPAPPISPPAAAPVLSTTMGKGTGVPLPFTAARPSATSGSGSDSPVSRRFVPGREMDMGPVGHEEFHDALPPDYFQATEPLPGQGLAPRSNPGGGGV